MAPFSVNAIKIAVKKAAPANGVKKPGKKPEKKPPSAKLQAKLEKFFGTSAQSPDTRPLPLGVPPVWAKARQALCETLPFYRKYQGASYTSGGFAIAMLLGKDCGELAYFDEQVVITRAGGCCEVGRDGVTRQVRNHSATRGEVRSFIASMVAGLPVILIIGNDNLTCPVKLDRRYSVMGHFQVTHVWPELNSTGVISFKYRFEKIKLDERSWWAVAGSAAPAPADSRPQLTHTPCSSCLESHPQILKNGWVCLNVDCDKFFKIDGTTTPSNLTYFPDFIDYRRPWPVNAAPLRSLIPQIPVNPPGQVYTSGSIKGMVCTACKCCIVRKHWDHWQCDCGFIHYPAQQQVQIQSLVGPIDTVRKNSCMGPVIQLPEVTWGNYRVVQYKMPSIASAVWHLKSNDAINSLPGGADDMFATFESDPNIGLRRWPRSQGNVSGEFFSTNFTHNFGLPYKFAVSVESSPFRDAPPSVIAGLQRLSWAGRSAVGKFADQLQTCQKSETTFKAFNELYAIGYMEEGKMDYHDDGEFGLGPTIASLSLGGTAHMHFRMKRQPYSGLNKNCTYDFEGAIIEGSLMKVVREDIQYVTANDPEFKPFKHALVQQMYTDFTLAGGRIGNSPDFLKLELKHGDIMVMHGTQLQQFYEHAVYADDNLRFAMTCRYVDPDTVDKKSHYMGEYDLTESMRYNGE